MELLAVFMPFISFLAIGLFGRHLGFIGSSSVSVFCMTLTVISSLYAFFEVVLLHNTTIITLGNWFEVALLKVLIGASFSTPYLLLCYLLLVLYPYLFIYTLCPI